MSWCHAATSHRDIMCHVTSHHNLTWRMKWQTVCITPKPGFFAQRCQNIMMSCRFVMTSQRDITCHTPSHLKLTWRHMKYESKSAHVNLSETPNITFFILTTLTFDLWPWPSNSSEISSKSIPIVNFRSIQQTVWLGECRLTDRQTDGQTSGTDFIPSNADAGGNKKALATWSTYYPPGITSR